MHPVSASPRQPLFDTHLHYDTDDAALYSPSQIIAFLDASGIDQAVVTASPPHHALALYRHAPERIVPFLGVYRLPADKQEWVLDESLPARVAQALNQGPWLGVGELHLFAEQRRSPVFRKVVDIATARGLPLLIHSDPAVIDSLFDHQPHATVIWAHGGAYPCAELLSDYLRRYPRLYVDLSVRDERIAPDGRLDPVWETVLLDHGDRFLVGVDTYRPERWQDMGRVTGLMRGWLAQLPDSVAAQIARGNAERLLTGGTKRPIP